MLNNFKYMLLLTSNIMKRPDNKERTETIRVEKKIKDKARAYCGQPPKRYSSLTQFVGYAILKEISDIEKENGK